MSYKVIKDFTDLQDNSHIYRAGDKFPRDGADVTQGRVDELASKKNRRKEALIEKDHKSSRPTKAELAAELTNPELYEAVEEKRAREAAEKDAESEAKGPEKPKNKETKLHKTEGKKNKNA